MKKYFWLGIAGLFLLELSNVYLSCRCRQSANEQYWYRLFFIKWRWLFRRQFAALLGLLRESERK
jgi:hypothetical protein